MLKKLSYSTSYLLPSLGGLLTVFVSIILYQNTQELFKWSLQNRVSAIAATAATQFDPNYLDQIVSTDSIGTEAYINTVKHLQKIRFQNRNLKFIYIQRQTADPNILEFVADADSMHPDIEIDITGDGIIDESDALNSPGEPYDASDYPDFVEIAFRQHYVDDELSIDQWGTHLSATSPIFGDLAEARYLIGVDMDVSDFISLTNLTLVPFLLVAGFQLLLLITLTIMLVRMWGSRVKLLQELDKQKDELLSIVSHQLAQPIAALKWYLEMLMDGDVGVLTKEQQEYLQTMSRSAANLADLSTMILDVSRFQLGKMKVDHQEVDFKVLLDDIVSVIDPKALEKKINFNKKITDKIPPVMILDRRLTRMTIENLLSNAVKYTPNGGTVDFTVERKNSMLHIAVKDTGIGIPEADQKKIFGKQFRASNTGDVDGNGFGLYVAKNAIEAQGGKIWFESKSGKGTTFFVDLPIVTEMPKVEAK